ncbi:MAG: TolC family outer membrane protein [Rhodospirillales bacterium]|nr:TolC family outer membrane protein [Rhodospirillales bacterium]
MKLRSFLMLGMAPGLMGALLALPAAARPPARHAPPTPPTRVPHTLEQALAATYLREPALQAERAKLRATDEDVPQARAGWRPTVVLAGGVGYGDGLSRSYNEAFNTATNSGWFKTQTDRDVATAQATVTQPLYTGGRTTANVHRAKDLVMAERASLIAQEETSLSGTVDAYVGVIQAQQLLHLNVNNEQVLRQQLRATEDQFQVGEVTRTDVAQAQAALAGAQAQRETSEGNLQTARAAYRKAVGFEPPRDLVSPQPLRLPVHTMRAASDLAAANNPSVIAARFSQAAARNAVSAAIGQLMPQLSLQGQIFQAQNSGARASSLNGYTALLNLSVPLYQGGSEYAAVRQARQTAEQQDSLFASARRTAIQNAVQSWQTYQAAKAAAASTRLAVRANEIALIGVEREHLVGTRTTLDVLNAQQALLNARVTLVQNLSNLVTASYAVAAAVGRLTARDLRLPVPLYDDTAYYNAVRNRWFGLSSPTGPYPSH